MLRTGKLAPLNERLAKLGLVTDWDFILHLPLRYEDETRIDPIGMLTPNEPAQVQGEVLTCRMVETGRGQQLVAEIRDDTGVLALRFIHYYPGTQSNLKPGTVVRVFGEARPAWGGGLEMIHPKVRKPVASEETLPSALTPVYPLGENIQQNWLRKRIARALMDLQGMEDPIPKALTEPLGLPGLRASLEYLHSPPPDANAAALSERTDPHWQRLKFDELVAQQITLREMRTLAARDRAPELIEPAPGSPAELMPKFRAVLPFRLTGAQERVWGEIERDLAQSAPMHRLVQGDVGSGKTVVAAMAALRAIEAGFQAALMAPTEILAEQHFRRIVSWLEPLGIRTVWLTGRQKTAERREAIERIASGEAQLAVGTHALIQEGVAFANLGLAIVDEQHRFGVAQRLALSRAARPAGEADDAPARKPHLLMLSATPIPRTLAMSYLADIDVSVIDELPPGRSPIETKLVRLDRRDAVVGVVKSTCATCRQVYWVCPLIEESEALDLTPAVDCAADLAARLPDLKVGLLHGAMTSAEKESVMSAFTNGEINVLVSTTVIEVGVDVPNATLMVIEHAERFGLAQLHQLRGRVGRGAGRSACVLLYDERLSAVGRERLRIIRESTDGFEIARRDLELRGPGEFLGEAQSGMPMLRFANLETDGLLVEAARDAASRMLAECPDAALRLARRWFRARADLLTA
ncbi:ATP-dependent DNA helicase RecG [Sutterella sp.]|uniref:ATP-dependent DNA helicase RecG n=1 Tax=Sutterella sp. TaxID=1981025 RepID=UPI0026DF494B|nr:ATP-dependent DNA helicase RecG [Sutterella sp.]MDO5531588.1 ATP-dependent DNA helicase RecG [Sutterella sp.]